MPERKNMADEIYRLACESYPGYESAKPTEMLKWYSKKFGLLNRAIQNRKMLIYRGEIYWCDLGENIGSEEVKLRPCVIIQNQRGNNAAPTTIIAPITNATITLPIAVLLNRGPGSVITGTVDLGQIKVVSKGRLFGRIGKLTNSEEKQVDHALMISLGTYKFVLNNDTKSEKIIFLSNRLKAVENTLNRIEEILGVEGEESILKSINGLKQ